MGSLTNTASPQELGSMAGSGKALGHQRTWTPNDFLCRTQSKRSRQVTSLGMVCKILKMFTKSKDFRLGVMKLAQSLGGLSVIPSNAASVGGCPP